RAWARGFIARWTCERPSHQSSAASLDAFLRAQGVPGIQEVDTRALTRHLRTHGTLRAVLSHEPGPPGDARLEELHGLAREVPPLPAQDLGAEVWRTAAEDGLAPLPPELRRSGHADGAGLTVCVVDYGVKWNILRSLRQRGCRVVVLPHTATWQDVRATGAG